MLAKAARTLTVSSKTTAPKLRCNRPRFATSGRPHAPFGTNVYKEHFNRSVKDPNAYWGEAASVLHWDKKWDQVLDSSKAPLYRWYSGGKLNACYNALDRHLKTRPDQKAIIYDSPVTGQIESLTYKELHAQVERFAGVLRDQGVKKGDVVLIYMPMIPQTAIAMLSCARLGAVHTVVFGGFASDQLALRINHAQPKVIITASCGVEPTRTIPYKPLLDVALEKSDWKPQSVILYQRKGKGLPLAELKPIEPRSDSKLPKSDQETRIGDKDSEIVASSGAKTLELDWDELFAKSSPAQCTTVLATDPLYMLYTSGTTGSPKAIVRDTGGYCVAMTWSLSNAFNLHPGDTIFAASDVGWVVGHSYIVYGPLLQGLTTVLYEGKPSTPDAGAFWRVVSQHRANCFFTAPTAFRSLKREDPDGDMIQKYDVSSLRSIWVAGEHADPNTIEWLQSQFKGVPIVDNAWQTETGWPITANPLGLEEHPVRPGSSCRPMPGYDLQVLQDDGSATTAGELGNLAIKLPLPPGTLPTLFKNDELYIESYLTKFPGYYNTGDAGMIDQDGYVYFMTRTDDIINVSGVRLSTGAIEEVISEHPNVAECAVIGPKDPLKGQVPVALIVLKHTGTKQSKNSAKTPDQVVQEVIASVRNKIGAIANFRDCAVVPVLPKTRSGKILRKTIKQIADGEEPSFPGTIDNPSTLDIATEALKKLGLPRKKEESL